jgi:hypothetical protein
MSEWESRAKWLLEAYAHSHPERVSRAAQPSPDPRPPLRAHRRAHTPRARAPRAARTTQAAGHSQPAAPIHKRGVKRPASQCAQAGRNGLKPGAAAAVVAAAAARSPNDTGVAASGGAPAHGRARNSAAHQHNKPPQLGDHTHNDSKKPQRHAEEATDAVDTSTTGHGAAFTALPPPPPQAIGRPPATGLAARATPRAAWVSGWSSRRQLRCEGRSRRAGTVKLQGAARAGNKAAARSPG